MTLRPSDATIPTMPVLYVRNLPPEVVATIRRRAASRGLKVEEFIEKLVELHFRALNLSDDDAVPKLAELLIDLGLYKVTD